MIISNTITNLRKQNIASGFGFWNQIAGFDISQTLDRVHARARPMDGRSGSACSIPSSSPRSASCWPPFVGFTMGIARLSSELADRAARHHLRRGRTQCAAAAAAVRLVFRGPENPAAAAPEPLPLPGGGFLNVRGLYLPAAALSHPASNGCRRHACRRHRRLDRHRGLVAPAAARDRPAFPGALDRARPDLRCCRCWLQRCSAFPSTSTIPS